MENDRKELFLIIFGELLKSERFTEFLEQNFDISQGVDHENKQVVIRVIEKPFEVRKHEFTLDQMVNLKKVIEKYAGLRADKAFQEIVDVIGGKANIPQIEIVGSLKDVDLDA